MPEFIRDVEEIRQRAIRNIEEGAVTEAYELDPERSVSILNEALATEIVCVLRYMHHYFMATGVHAKAVSDEFKEHADAEREHADEIAERIQQLGGKPDLNPATLVQRSVAQYVEGESLGDMIREDLIAERVVIDVYNQMIRYFGEKDPTTRVLLEHILSEEEQHASDLADLLYIVEPQTGETEGEDPGVRPLKLKESVRDRAQGRYEDDIEAAEIQNAPRRGASNTSGAGGQERMSQQQKNQPRSGDLAARQSQESFSGRGSAAPTGKRTPSMGEGEMRPSRATGRNRPDEQSMEPAHEPGTVGRRRRNDVEMTGLAASEDVNEGAMGGGTRAVRVTNKNRKNRAA